MLHVIGQGFKDAMSCQTADEYYDRPSIKTLHALFISLFCPVDLTETMHDMSIHVCAFMRLASLNEHLVVHSPTRVMALTSRLEYLFRSAILIEVRSVGVYSVNPLPQDARMRDSLRFILSSQFNVMSRVVGVAKVAFSVGQATFTSVSTSSDGMHVCINNKTASLAAIQDMVNRLIKETKQSHEHWLQSSVRYSLQRRNCHVVNSSIWESFRFCKVGVQHFSWRAFHSQRRLHSQEWKVV